MLADRAHVKLRPVDPAQLAPKLRRSSGFGVELDAMPAGTSVPRR
jgi:hypothetical protein